MWKTQGRQDREWGGQQLLKNLEAARLLTFPLATALHLNLRLASARSRASCSSLAKVQCRFWLLLWYIAKAQSRPRESGKKHPTRHNTVRGKRHLRHKREPTETEGVLSAGADALTLRSCDISVRSRVSGADYEENNPWVRPAGMWVEPTGVRPLSVRLGPSSAPSRQNLKEKRQAGMSKREGRCGYMDADRNNLRGVTRSGQRTWEIVSFQVGCLEYASLKR